MQLIIDLTNVYSFAAKFNYPTAKLGRSPVANPLDKIINMALEETDPIHLPIGHSGCVSCFNHTDPGFIRTGVSLIETRPFDYITCSYMPLKSSNVPQGTIFPPFLTASDSQPQY
ncbi:hypothetical protein K449DRAFT_388015 [Hypoxylon sp. EC38]|nr:hypothetical protein K449DRAFT_388015 [Hypoxylon sp. EC38]